jgi:hypothetical protein
MNKPHSVQQVVPADTCDRENGEGSAERAVPAEVAALEAALRTAEAQAQRIAKWGYDNSYYREAVKMLREDLETKRSQAATGGNSVLNGKESV